MKFDYNYYEEDKGVSLTQTEFEVLLKLKSMKRYKKQINLSLWPPAGYNTIQTIGSFNTMFINEGRDGKFEKVSNAFYNEMVSQFDSRYKK